MQHQPQRRVLGSQPWQKILWAKFVIQFEINYKIEAEKMISKSINLKKNSLFFVAQFFAEINILKQVTKEMKYAKYYFQSQKLIGSQQESNQDDIEKEREKG